MNLPVREVGVVTTLALLSYCSAHGLAKVARRLDDRAPRTAYEEATDRAATPRSTRDLMRAWDEMERCSEFRASSRAAESWLVNVYETL